MRYIAKFDPQAWIKDNAVSVDPEGETAWDVTDFIRFLDLANKADAEIEANGFFLDRDDVLLGDAKAPAWAREWSGPFTITVTKENP